MDSYGQFAYSYDTLTKNIDYEKRGEFFHSILRRCGKEKGILVDLACGTGSLSEFFARFNYDVIGIDASEEMLSIAQEKKLESGNDIFYLCQRMQDLDLFGTVDVVICALDSLNHIIDQEELQQIFERISLFLNEDAIFIFDINTIYKHEKTLGNNTFVYDMDDVYCVWQNRIRENHIVDISLDIFEYDEVRDVYERYEEHFCERAYSPNILEGMLNEAGFRLQNWFADDIFDAPGDKSERLIGVFRNIACKNHIPGGDK